MREMKDSGIEWLGKIPNDWNVGRIKNYVSKVGSGKTPKGDNKLYTEGKVLFLRSQNIYDTGIVLDFPPTVITDAIDNEMSNTRVVKDDVLLNITGGSIGRCCIYNLNEKANVNQHVSIIRTQKDKMLPGYMHYFWISNLGQNAIHLYQTGGNREGMSAVAIKNTPIPIMSLSEQKMMVDFLDTKCADIDSLAEDIQKQIETLKEYKKSIITQAVTKGLDPNVEMKDSGIEWIGKIPQHWKIKRLKNIICDAKDGIKIGPFGSALSNKIISGGPYSVYGQANLVNDDFSHTKNTINEKTYYALKAYQVVSNDICLSMMGTIGKCKIVPVNIKPGIMDSHLIKIRLDKVQMLSKFFEYVYDKDLSSICITEMQYVKKGSIMDGLNTSIVKNLRLIVPPIVEQQAIADFLDSKCADIDVAIEGKQKQLDVLKEYKKSLIYEYVTGKKEVPCGE